MSATNIITVEFGSSQLTFAPPQYQYNYGQILLFSDLDLPTSYEVHFANASDTTSITQIGDSEGVTIPDQFFESGETIRAWVFLHADSDDGETVYEVRIPIIKRAEPSDDEPTTEEQSAITQAIAALNSAVTACETAVTETETNVTHYPKIENGTWWVWDADSSAWVDTEVTAEGTDGRGITSIELTSTVGLVDTYTITFTDGTTSTFTVTNGQDGDDYVLTDADKTEIASLISAPVEDVQIDGTSIISDNVANIPIATTSNDGAMSAEQASHLDTVYADYSSALTALGVI